MSKTQATAHRLYALVRDTPNGSEIVYRLGESPREVWDAVLEEQTMGTGHSKFSLMARGYRAKPVTVLA